MLLIPLINLNYRNILPKIIYVLQRLREARIFMPNLIFLIRIPSSKYQNKLVFLKKTLRSSQRI